MDNEKRNIALHQYLIPNNGNVSSKVVDGEAILIDLSNGMYYSMPSVAGFIWSLVDQGHGLDAISAAVASRYDVAEDIAKQDVEALAQQLLDENLVVSGESGTVVKAAATEHEAVSEAYSTPLLNKFDDMVDLFALDPPLPGLSELKRMD